MLNRRVDGVGAGLLDPEAAAATLAAIVASAEDAIVGSTLDGVVVSWNAGAEGVYEYSAEEMIGQPLARIAPDDRRDEFLGLVDRVRRGERVRQYETERIRKDGVRITVALTVSLVTLPSGQIVGVSAIGRDITEQVRTLRALQNSEARHRGILESALDAIVTIDSDGHVIEFNPAAESLFGWSRDEALGRELASFLVPPRLRDDHRTGLARYRATGEGTIVGRRVEMPALCKDGTEVSVELTVAEVQLHDPGAPRMFSASLRDLTEQKQAALLNARLAAIVNSSTDAIISTSLDGTIESWNDGAARIYGYTAEEMIGRSISILAPPERMDEIPDLLVRVARGERIQTFETVRLAKDGRRIDIALSLAPIRRLDGSVGAISAVGRDITKRKRAAREGLAAQLLETQKLESLGVLAGGVAHDFNNLLTSILGNAALIAPELPPGSMGQAAVAQIELATGRAAELTRQMLAFAGDRRYIVESLNLADLVGGMADLMKTMVPREATLNLELDSSVPAIQADRAELRQVVLSLLTNAYEGLNESRGVITVRTGTIDADADYLDGCEQTEGLRPGPYAVLEIADTGRGMDWPTRERMFEPFFTTKFIGRGLGLAAVLGIVRGHGGTVRVDTVLGAGTSVAVLFPAASA